MKALSSGGIVRSVDFAVISAQAHGRLVRDQVKHGLAMAGLAAGLPADLATKQKTL